MMRKTALACLGIITVVVTALLAPTPGTARDPSVSGAPEPVESSMHEFMEYYFQPTYKRLRASMAKNIRGERDFKAIKADSLVLAEGANLLLGRVPDEDGADWTRHSLEVRKLGAELYAAARKKEFDASHDAYGRMLEACNRCHQQFADGKYQLKP